MSEVASRRSTISLIRQVLAAGVALAVLASFADTAAAARSKAAKSSRAKEASKGGPFGEIPKGPLQLVVSIASQHVTLYSNGVRVAQAPVSTGVPGHPTPTGVFSIIQKDRYHHSNLYSNAPMYYMERITWSGVALHEGPLPGGPASHGCIRMPGGFASKLWGITKLGVRVIVTRNDLAPYEFSHAKLFNPKPRPEVQVAAVEPNGDPRPALADSDAAEGSAGQSVVLAQVEGGSRSKASDAGGHLPDPPVIEARGLGTSAAPAAGDAQGAAMPARQAPAAAVPVSNEPEKPAATQTEPQKPAVRTRTAEPKKRSGQVAVFVSRKEKKIYVRQGMVPVFDMPVEIADPDQPLGTHVFTAMEVEDGGAHMRWNAISMPAERVADGGARRRGGRSGRRSEPLSRQPIEAKPVPTAAQALDRIQIPQEAIDRISELLIPGSSLVVSDYGLGGETGRDDTEFIVVTHN